MDFEHGVGGFSFEFDQSNVTGGSLYLSLVPSSNKASISNTGSYPYRDLFSTSNSKMVNIRGTNFIGIMNAGGIVNVVLNMD